MTDSYMLLSETLWKHLAEVDEECNEMMDRLVKRMVEREGVTEQLKSDDWLCWLQKINSIRNRAEEVVKAMEALMVVPHYGYVVGHSHIYIIFKFFKKVIDI